jgi:hypothetical protein
MEKFGSVIRDKHPGSATLINKFQVATRRWCPCTMCGRRVRSTGSGSCASCACPGSTTWPPATPPSRRMRKAMRQGTLSPSLCDRGSCRPGLLPLSPRLTISSSVVDPDPGSVGSLDPDPDSQSGSRRATMNHENKIN